MFLVVWNSPARAQDFVIQIPIQCGNTENLLKVLKDKYKEVSIGGGISKGELVRLFASHTSNDEQTWTLVVSNPNGISCLIKGGQNWLVEPLIKKGDPS